MEFLSIIFKPSKALVALHSLLHHLHHHMNHQLKDIQIINEQFHQDILQNHQHTVRPHQIIVRRHQ